MNYANYDAPGGSDKSELHGEHLYSCVSLRPMGLCSQPYNGDLTTCHRTGVHT